MVFTFSQESLKLKRVLKLHSLFVKGFFFFNANIEEAQVLDDTEKDSGGLCSTGKN